MGAAIATKWNGVWYIPVFAGLVIAWDLAAGTRARASAGEAGDAGEAGEAGSWPRWSAWLRSDARRMPLWFGLIPAVVYTASWAGWFATPYGYNRNGAALNDAHPAGTIASWLSCNHYMLTYSLGLTGSEPYRSSPLGWLVLARPLPMYSVYLPRAAGSGPSTEQEILAIGTPAIWWAAAAAVLFCLGWWVVRRDWRVSAALAGIAAGWLPWIWFYLHDHRLEYYYYAIAFEPFLIIAIVLCLELALGPPRASRRRRRAGALAVGVYLVAAVADFAYLYPLLTAKVVPYSAWLARMWLQGWI
jgi:dolichyl-phosphate-mannose--protein O-mannosyl transferase